MSPPQDAHAAVPCEHEARRFGAHIRSLRLVRGLTQEQLADRCDLSADTIRRIEHGAFHPSLETINKVCLGLDLTRSVLFESLELPGGSLLRELHALASMRPDSDLELALATVRALFEQIDRQRAVVLLVVAPDGEA